MPRLNQQPLAPADFAAVVFDMDGTMVDTELIYHIAWREAAAALGYTLTEETLLATTGRRIVDCYALLAEALGPTFPMPAFKASWEGYWHREIEQHGVPLKPGLLELLALLEARGIPKAVATSTERADARFTLEKADLLQRFPILTTGDEIQHGKPAPDIFLLAAERLGVPPSRCLALEDSVAGAIAASTAGMTTIMFPDMIQPPPEVAARLHSVVASLHDVHHWISTTWPT